MEQNVRHTDEKKKKLLEALYSRLIECSEHHKTSMFSAQGSSVSLTFPHLLQMANTPPDRLIPLTSPTTGD